MKQNKLITGILIIIILGAVGLGIFLLLTSSSEGSDLPEANPTEVAGIPTEAEVTEALPTEVEADQALQALTEYLAALHSGDYASAEPLYGGSYEMLEGYNPDVDPADHAQLLQRACEMNGLNCLELMNANLEQGNSENEFVFSVELQTDDGGLFEIGPCCGEDEEGFVPVSVFTFTVIRVAPDQYQVMDLPPYTP
jgi:hypothetical protein